MQSRIDALSRETIDHLVKRAQEGDTASFAGLYEHFYDKIFRYIVFKTGNSVDGEDLTEEVFLRMLESISSFSWRGYPFSSWLFRIAHNLVVDHYRKKGRQKTVPIEDADGMTGASSYDMDSGLDMKLSMQQVYASMQGLSTLQREVLNLRFAGGLSLKETAESLGKKENAIKALQHAALKKLRSLLAKCPTGSQDQALTPWNT